MIRLPSFLSTRDTRFLIAGVGAVATTWRVAWLLPAAIVGSLLGAALATALLYKVLADWQIGAGTKTARVLLEISPQRMFSSLRWIVLLVVIPLIMRACGFRSLASLGIDFSPAATRRGRRWYYFALALVAVMATLQVHLVPGSVKPAPDNRAFEIGKVLAAGYIGGLGEEIIFSGFVLRLFYSATRSPALALLMSSLFFAYAHIKAPRIVLEGAAGTLGLEGALKMAFGTLVGITSGFDPAYIGAVWLLGMTCGALTLRNGTIWPAVGLHAGLVTGMLFLQRRWIADPGPARDLWGSAHMIDGIVPLAVLALLLAWAVWAPASPPAAGPAEGKAVT